MAGRPGKSFVVQMGDGASSETFTTIGGGREHSSSGQNPYVDASDKDSTWREGQANAANKSLTINGSGRYKTGSSNMIEDLRDAWKNGTAHNFRLLTDTGVGYQGAFFVTQFDESGSDGDVQQYSFTLDNTGTVTHGNIS